MKFYKWITRGILHYFIFNVFSLDQSLPLESSLYLKKIAKICSFVSVKRIKEEIIALFPSCCKSYYTLDISAAQNISNAVPYFWLIFSFLMIKSERNCHDPYFGRWNEKLILFHSCDPLQPVIYVPLEFHTLYGVRLSLINEDPGIIKLSVRLDSCNG